MSIFRGQAWYFEVEHVVYRNTFEGAYGQQPGRLQWSQSAKKVRYYRGFLGFGVFASLCCFRQVAAGLREAKTNY